VSETLDQPEVAAEETDMVAAVVTAAVEEVAEVRLAAVQFAGAAIVAVDTDQELGLLAATTEVVAVDLLAG
jgi:Tfp pilus assembly PilM family ATPase